MIIERTTQDYQNETINLFDLIRPLLDKGESYSSSVKLIRRTHAPSTNLAWYQDLIKYGESQGYPYKEYMRKKSKVHHHARLKVVEKTTAERYEEIVQLFKEIKPLLDNGVPFYRAVMKVKGLKHVGFLNQAWYKDLLEYTVSKGYNVRWNDDKKLVNGGYRV